MSMHLSEAPRSKLRRQIAVEPVTTTIGAEIKGVDLGKGIDDELFRVLHEALMTHQVIFLRDQNLTTEQHRDLAGRFGEPAYSKKLPMYDGIETVSLLENDGSKRVVGDIWHTDNTDFENPPMGALLYAKAAPSVGGDTNWVSAHDQLRSQRYEANAVLKHDAGYKGVAYALIELESGRWKWAFYPKDGPPQQGEVQGTREHAEMACMNGINQWFSTKSD